MTASLSHARSNRAGSSRCLLVAGLIAMAGLTAVANAGASSGGDEQPGSSVTRIRRGGASNGSSVGIMRGSRVEATQEAPARASEPTPLALSPSGSTAPDALGGDEPEPLIDLDPDGAGLPDAVEGEAPDAPIPNEVIVFADIGVRGERSGRIIKLVGAELAFADCEVLVSEGTPLGYTGVMGQVGPNAGSAPALRFRLESGGTVTLTVQPLPGNRATPNRPVRTVTMQVP